MRKVMMFGAFLASCLAGTAAAQNAAWRPDPWLADLAQMRAAR